MVGVHILFVKVVREKKFEKHSNLPSG